MSDLKELYAALVQAQSHAQAVEKTAVNAYLKYRYASAEAIIDEARQALNASGLALITMTWRLERTTEETIGPIGRIHVEYRLVHSSGESLDIGASTPVIPDKGRPADKAEAAALTSNLGYLLRGLLLLPRVDEADAVDARDDRKYEPRAQAPAQTTDAFAQYRARFETAKTVADVDAITAALGTAFREKKLPDDLRDPLKALRAAALARVNGRSAPTAASTPTPAPPAPNVAKFDHSEADEGP